MPRAKVPDSIGFVYRNAQGEEGERHVVGWREAGRYICGRDRADGRFKSFRIDRVVRYIDASERWLAKPFQDPPPELQGQLRASPGSSSLQSATGPEVCFTGFAVALRAQLEARARAAGLSVVQSVTVGLTFLVCGPNAGPSKVEKARKRYVYILDAQQLDELVESGVLPDPS